MERQPYDADRVSKTRRIPYRTTKKLGRSYKEATKSIEAAQKNMKKQYDKQQRNS